ncbi:hypothetical protein K5E68_12535 [Acinetobacter baumannii]|uniref:hypothetical protein n=1 Tax=Acinetobacter baumannii TaxID=470 RepID=UPI001FF3AE77|nr:hypothetical protein [Acinetobacter baumannii]MCJ8793719.1 hypothetical protein [Acinetobacter baumannii]MCJ8878348.1 hypothetical protein [Acinetobacter baumannii]MCJ8980355.1 hypothetical protein [Acinetobacter baumannii]MCJ9021053.1 hypothetical protein [Acinetobacter baumannii]MCJ9026806.1 hypothetical protein [Acinetobacter baumannii]
MDNYKITATGRFDENGEHHLTFSNGTEEKDPALISGAEAFTYLIGGNNDVQTKLNDTEKWRDVPTGMSWAAFANPDRKFRLKPQTIKVELELPKPFEPQMGDRYWIIHPAFKRGYTEGMFGEADKHEAFQQFGAYRTEDDVKKAVEQLRKIRGANS